MRHALEHVCLVRPADLFKFSELGVIPSMQPTHFTNDYDGIKLRFGEKRTDSMYAVKTLIDSGAVPAFGSDAPFADMNPLVGIYSAVTRATTGGYPEGGISPEQKLNMRDVLTGYTYGGAYLSGTERQLGTIEAGKLADITVLSRNLFNIRPEEILDTTVLLTMMDGRVVYNSGD